MAWFEESFRRNVLDLHIEEWDESFLSLYEPRTYVELLKKAQVQSVSVFSNSHVGYCYWPTKVGHVHRGIRGRDIVGETINLCKKVGIYANIGYSLIFNNWAYQNNPGWRIVDMEGRTSRWRKGRSGRYGVCCPNSSGYRDFVRKQVEELCDSYEFGGMGFDMTLWPGVCACSSCKKRFATEVGGEIPKIIDWQDPHWLFSTSCF